MVAASVFLARRLPYPQPGPPTPCRRQGEVTGTMGSMPGPPETEQQEAADGNRTSPDPDRRNGSWLEARFDLYFLRCGLTSAFLGRVARSGSREKPG